MNENYALAGASDPNFDEPHVYTKSYGDGSPRGICRCMRAKEHKIHIQETIKNEQGTPALAV